MTDANSDAVGSADLERGDLDDQRDGGERCADGADKTITTLEDTGYAFSTSDFGFGDPKDNSADTLLAVKITTVPVAGTLKLSGVTVSAGDVIAAGSIANLVYTPGTDANGASYASFSFQVQDTGGTANGGVDLDLSANTITFDVTPVNDAPAGTDKTVTTREDTGYVFSAADFGFGDVKDSPSDTLMAVKITTVPVTGTLKLSGAIVNAGDVIAAASIGNLVYLPGADANGASYASFTFQVQDTGGVANGGVDLDQSANTITVNVTAVNDAPAGADKTVTTLEDTAYVFSAADFGFTDATDAGSAAGGNSLLAVEVSTLPGTGAGTLEWNNSTNWVAVTAGQFVTAADIAADKLRFAPAANANGAGLGASRSRYRTVAGPPTVGWTWTRAPTRSR